MIIIKNIFRIYYLYLILSTLPLQGTTNINLNSNNQNKLICIDKNKSYKNKHFFLQESTQKVEYIKLETNDNCLIGKEINIETIRATETDIFIIEMSAIYRFSRKDGKFLNQIGKRGQGPKEFLTKQSFSINKNKQEVILYDIGKRKIHIYDYNGTHKRDINIPELSQIEVVDEDIFAGVTYDTKTNIPGFGLYSLSNGKLIKKLSECYTSRSGIVYRLFSKYTTARPNNGEAFFSTYITDNIFSINKNARIPRYVFLPPNNGKTTEDNKYCTTPFLICETDLFANIQVHGINTKEMESFIINKKTGIITKGYIINSDYSGPIFPYNTGVDNEIAALHYAYILKDREKKGVLFGKLKEIAKTLDEEDNPVVVIANF